MFLFFALSGFLITQLLLEEYDKSDRVKLRPFLRRRIVRLVPALAAFLAVWFVVVVVFRGSGWLTTVPQGGPSQYLGIAVALEGVAASLSYLMNWIEIFKLFSGYVPIGHIWSLGVEMQFYLVWAALLALLLRFGRRRVLWIAVLGSLVAGAEALLFMHSGVSGLRIYMGTDVRAGALLAGSAASLIWCDSRINFQRSRIFGLLAALSAGVIAWSIYAFMEPTLSIAQQAAWPLSAAASAVLVIYMVERPHGILARNVTRPSVIWLGKRSYALYLWHYAWLTWLRDLGFIGVLAGFGMSLISAELSWRLVERPASRKFAAARDGVGARSIPDVGTVGSTSAALLGSSNR